MEIEVSPLQPHKSSSGSSRQDTFSSPGPVCTVYPSGCLGNRSKPPGPQGGEGNGKGLESSGQFLDHVMATSNLTAEVRGPLGKPHWCSLEVAPWKQWSASLSRGFFCCRETFACFHQVRGPDGKQQPVAIVVGTQSYSPGAPALSH